MNDSDQLLECNALCQVRISVKVEQGNSLKGASLERGGLRHGS